MLYFATIDPQLYAFKYVVLLAKALYTSCRASGPTARVKKRPALPMKLYLRSLKTVIYQMAMLVTETSECGPIAPEESTLRTLAKDFHCRLTCNCPKVLSPSSQLVRPLTAPSLDK